jgi:aminopeptidase N
LKKLFLYLLCIALPFSFAYSQSAGGPHNYIPQQFDVLEYSPILKIANPISREVVGTNSITIEWKNPAFGNKFYFHNLGIVVDSVFYNGTRVSVSKVTESNPPNEYNSIEATDDSKLAVVKVYYSGKMKSEGGNFDWGGVHYSQGLLFSVGVGFFNDNVSCTRNWMPCFDLPSDKALYTGTFIVPDTLTAISNGKLIEQKDTLNGFRLYKWTLGEAPASTYLLTFAVGKFRQVHIPTEGVPVTAYMYDDSASELAGKTAFKLVPKMISAYEDFFSHQYPYETMGYYGASIGAMEHQTMVTISQSEVKARAAVGDTMYYVAAHELGHQWFGDLVSPYDFRDAWLNEGFATFTEYVWRESQFGSAEYMRALLSLRSDYIDNTASLERHIPLYDFHRFSKNNYPSTIYKKGALVVALIRQLVGDSTFKAKMRSYLSDYEYGNVTTQLLADIFSDVLPQKFWDTWVYGRGFPLIDIESYQDGVNTYIIAKQRDSDFQVYDLTLDYRLAFDGEEYNVSHAINAKIDTLIVPQSSVLSSLEVLDNLYLYKIMSINIFSSIESEKDAGISIKDNALNDLLEINFEKAKQYAINIVTLNGKSVFIKEGNFVGTINIDTSAFVAGTYFVYIRYDNKTIVKKIMAQ